jgi:hypothetical protein
VKPTCKAQACVRSEGAEQGQDHLTAVGMTSQDQVRTSIFHHRRREIGMMYGDDT